VAGVTGFRFSYNIFGIGSGEDFAETCRRGERHGYDTVFAADHLGVASPFPALVAAAAATQRLRVGTLVLNAPFWNPTLLAREVSTTDVLTGGRLELGLGAGHMKWSSTKQASTGSRLASGLSGCGRRSSSCAGSSPQTAMPSRRRCAMSLASQCCGPCSAAALGATGRR
jgi:hypothetical protein